MNLLVVCVLILCIIVSFLICVPYFCGFTMYLRTHNERHDGYLLKILNYFDTHLILQY